MSGEEFASFEELVARLIELLQAQEDAKWEMGDLLLLGRAKFGGRGYARAVATELGCSARHVERLMRTAHVFPPEARVPDLSWSHHEIAARTQDAERWLNAAVENGWSVRQLQQAIREAEGREVADAPDADAEMDALIRELQERIARFGRAMLDGLRRLYLVVSEVLEQWENEGPGE